MQFETFTNCTNQALPQDKSHLPIKSESATARDTTKIQEPKVRDFVAVRDVQSVELGASFGNGVEHDVGCQILESETNQVRHMTNALQQ